MRSRVSARTPRPGSDTPRISTTGSSDLPLFGRVIRFGLGIVKQAGGASKAFFASQGGNSEFAVLLDKGNGAECQIPVSIDDDNHDVMRRQISRSWLNRRRLQFFDPAGFDDL